MSLGNWLSAASDVEEIFSSLELHALKFYSINRCERNEAAAKILKLFFANRNRHSRAINANMLQTVKDT